MEVNQRLGNSGEVDQVKNSPPDQLNPEFSDAHQKN